MTKKEQKHIFCKKHTSNTFLHAKNAFLDLENIVIDILQAIVLCEFMTHCEEMNILAAIFNNGYCTDPNRDCRWKYSTYSESALNFALEITCS